MTPAETLRHAARCLRERTATGHPDAVLHYAVAAWLEFTARTEPDAPEAHKVARAVLLTEVGLG